MPKALKIEVPIVAKPTHKFLAEIRAVKRDETGAAVAANGIRWKV